MSHDAYRRAAVAGESAREAEYRAFGDATRRLIAAEEKGRDDLRGLIEAVHANRQLWGTLAGDCARPENALPAETRAAIVSLARWVDAYSSRIMREKEPLEPLIDINRIIMEGLTGRPAA